jgi:hypothetical protein
MMKRFYHIFFICILAGSLSAEEVVISNKAVKIGNELILKTDIEKYAKKFKVTPDEAKNILIDHAVLFLGSRMYAPEPTEVEIDNYIKKQKNYYANKIGKDARIVTDDEFLAALNYSGTTIGTYKYGIKKELWIEKYIDQVVAERKLPKYTPGKEEVDKVIKNMPELFQEKEGVKFSMIYFSGYTKTGSKKDEKDMETQNALAKKCLAELEKGENFEKMVEKYSEDLISKNNTPRGRAGLIAFDDPRSLLNFSQIILDELKKSNAGIVKKIFPTKNGLYIFKIDEKVKPKILDDQSKKNKAETHLEKEYEKKMKEALVKEIIKELREKVEIINY